MKKTIIICVSVVVAALGFFAIAQYFKTRSDLYTVETTVTTETEVKTTSKSTSIIVVEIKGMVKYPGIYQFSKDEVLVQDVILIAGGLLDGADVSSLNLASLVSNHSSIIIVSNGGKSYILGEGETLSLININTATEEELTELPEIGEVIAKSIVDYRKEHGFFTDIEDIKNVNGIGDAVYEQIKDFITVWGY